MRTHEVSSTTAERNEVNVLAKACKASVATASLLADMTEPKPRTP